MPRLVVFICLLAISPISNADSIWFSNHHQARNACENDAPSDTSCQVGGFGSFFSYRRCFGGGGWRYCNAPVYTWVPCSHPAHVDPFDGYRTESGGPRPGCITPPPDLTASFDIPAIPPEFAPGATIPVSSAMVANASEADKEKSTVAAFYLSTDTVFDDADQQLATQSVPPRPGDSTYELGINALQLPAAVPGSYYVILVANHTFIGKEKTFDNNAYPIPIEILEPGKPDLVASLELLLERPYELYPKAEVDAILTVANEGERSADAQITSQVYLSRDSELDDADRLLATVGSLPGLGAGDSNDFETTIRIPEDVTEGAYSLLGVTVATGGLDEHDLQNNVMPVEVEIVSPKIEVEICVGNPITTNSGRKIETEVDYQGTGPFPLMFARYYNSRPGNTEGWSPSYSRRLLVVDRSDGTTDVILELDDSMRLEFEDIDARGFSDPDVPGFLSRTEDGFAYLDPQGTVHEFDSAGRLMRAIDQQGFVQTMGYEDDRLVAVTDHFGRSLTFEHVDGRVASMTTPDNETWRYDYNAEGLLTSVTLPDETPAVTTDNPGRTYLYESPHLAHGLTGIIDENGGRFSTFDYDEQGRAILSTHAGGAGSNTVSYGDSETTVTGPLGKDTTYVFEEILGTNRLVRVDGHATVNCPATQTTRDYDERGSVTREVDANGNVTEYTYAHTGLADDEYLYHVGLPIRVTEAVGTAEARTTEIEWHPEFRLPGKVVEPGRTTTFTYDEDARLLQRAITAHDTGAVRAWTYAYNDDGLPVEINGPRTDINDTTHLAYNAAGDVTAVTNAMDHVTRILDHSADGQPLAMRDPNGLITRLDYDARGRLESMAVESDAGTATTSVDYDAKGNVVAIRLPDGQALRYTYDAADRLIGIENDLGETIEFTLDADGNRTAEVTRAADNTIVRVQKRAFDELSRVIETIGTANQTTEIRYDLNGNLDVIEDALGRQSSMAFDGLDRLVSIIDALGGESTFTYDARDNLTSVTDAEGVTTTYVYDGHDNLTREVSTASGTTRHRYDGAGNRIETTDARGIVTEYRYDALNRLTAIAYPSAPQENITYTYDEGADALGRLTGIVDPSGETTFGYDDRGNLIRDQRIIDGVNYTTRYEYNLAGQLTAMVYPSGRIVRYELDDLSRVERITTQATAASPVKVVAGDLDYLPYGPAGGWTHGNGVETEIGYDKDYRITDIDVADLDAIMSLTYQYNDVSNISGMLDNLGMNSQSFGYDELNRLTEADGNYGAIDYTYDGVGNRTSRTIGTDESVKTEQYTYESGSHRLQSVATTEGSETTTRQFNHDANGNTVSDVSPDRALELSVNARNRLAAIDKDGRRVGEYEYNALGQRVAKTSRYRGRLHAHFDQGQNHRERQPSQNNVVLSDSEGSPNGKAKNDKANKSQNPVALSDSEGPHNGKAKNGKDYTGQSNLVPSGAEGPQDPNAPTRNPDGLHSHHDNKPVTERLHFHYDHRGNLIAESDENGNTVREYLYLGRYRIAMTTQSLPTLVPSEAEGPRRQNLALYFIHNDHLGTPMKVTDSEQRMVWSMEQTPFGEVALTTEGIRLPMRFPGQYADIESSLSYNYFRDYDPSLGRYIQSDPIALTGGPNTFIYGFSDPLSNQDPTGLIVPILARSVASGIFFGALNAISAHIQHPDASFEQLALSFGVGFASGAISGLGLGKAGTVLQWMGQGAIIGSIQGAGEKIIFDGDIADVGLAAIVSAVAGGIANNTALGSALMLLKSGLGKRIATSDFLGTATGSLVSEGTDIGLSKFPGLRLSYCGKTLFEI